MHLAIKAGTDVALFNGLLTNLVGANAVDHAYVAAHTSGARDALAAARALSFSQISAATGLTRLQLHDFYELFTATDRVVTVYSQGVNQSSAGSDKVNAILNCHLATGRIGKPGMGPFSVTGQPNAMGGREVGGLANMLAAHMDFDNAEHRETVRAFWDAPRMAVKPGFKAVDMFRAVGDGRIKAIWIMATNPVDSLPQANNVRAALKACPFVVVSDVAAITDTAAFAHVQLPSLAWGEKDGTVTNSERRISRQRPFLAPPGEARPDWWQLAEVAKRMGHGEAFSWAGPDEIFKEHAALTACDNGGRRDLDIGACAHLTLADYDTLRPFQWPRPRGEAAGSSRLFADGRYFTPDRRARFVATPFRAPLSTVSDRYPLVLNTGRIRDQWHTMTRTGKSARLLSHSAEPFVEVHPADAATLGLRAAHLATVTSRNGRVIVRVVVTERTPPGSVFVPIHWTDQLSSAARVDTLVASNLDPVSGQPELKFTPVRVEPFAAAWYGYAVCTSEPGSIPAEYWTIAPAGSGMQAELAGTASCPDATRMLNVFLPPGTSVDAVDVLAYHDRAGGEHRLAAFRENCLVAALFIAPVPVSVARAFMVNQIGKAVPDAADRYRLLAGRPPGDVPDRGPIVCACMDVGRNLILDAIVRGGCTTIEAIGHDTRAGTNCGSCRPEIGALIDACRIAKAS